MSNFAILRIQKHKSAVSVRASLMHAFREQETPNADENRLDQNSKLFSENSDQALEKYNERLAIQKHVRKNAVTCVEFLITASPEVMAEMSKQEQDKYFDDAREWLEEKHGKENIIHFGVHRDETTPYITAFIVRIDFRASN